MYFSKNLNLEILETELQKRLNYPYHWQRIQNDIWDKATRFIYKTNSFEDLLIQIKSQFKLFKSESTFEAYFNYAINRWYNFWSAKAVEYMFTRNSKVKAHKNTYDKYIDFWLDNIPFDHKTSIFPKGFNKNLEYAKSHKVALTKWLYNNQSKQGRMHFKNRLFVVMYQKDGAHWMLKANLKLIKIEIENYLQNFKADNLINLSFKTEKDPTLTDVIFVTK